MLLGRAGRHLAGACLLTVYGFQTRLMLEQPKLAKRGHRDFDVFMAHNSQDKSRVEAIGAELRGRGLKPWIDKEQVPPGRWFQDVIQEAIPNVRSAAIFMGPNGIGKWQAVELRAFISQCVEKNIPVIPVLLPGVSELPPSLLFLKELKWVRFSSNINEQAALDNLEWGITGRRPDGRDTTPAHKQQKPKKAARNPKFDKRMPKVPTAGVCSSSADWILLGTHFFEADEVLHNADGTITVTIEVRSPEEIAWVKGIHAGRSDMRREMPFAHGDDGQVVSVAKVDGRSSGARQLWTLNLLPENIRYGGGSMEASVQGHSADEIAEMRAGRLLLNNPPAPPRDARRDGFDLVEMYVRGPNARLPADDCILPAVYKQYGRDPHRFLPSALLLISLAQCRARPPQARAVPQRSIP
jgi:hypothetical protein